MTKDVDRAKAMTALWLNGWTLEAIGKQYGISRQAVHCILHQKGRKNAAKCIYTGLRKWLFANCTCRELHDGAGLTCSMTTFYDKLRGEKQFRVDEIRKITRHTGRSFEELFGEEDRHDATDTQD